MRTTSSLGTVIAVAFAGVVAACAAGGGNHFTTGSGAGGPGGAGGAGSTGTDNTSSGSLGGGGSFTTVGSGMTTTSGSGGMPGFYAYAHDNTTLYRLDPNAADLGVTKIGTFDCIGGSGQDSSMTDVAVDAQGNVWGISTHYVYPLQIQGSKVHCQANIGLNNPKNVKFYALTFAPTGTIYTGEEALIAGNTAGELWEVGTKSGGTGSQALGQLTQRGTLGNVPAADPQGHSYPSDPSKTGNTVGTPWQISGDIVFLADNNNPIGFATVRDCSGSTCSNTDTLMQINVSALKTATTQSVALGLRGQVLKAAGCNDPNNTSYGSTYGIAAWNSKVYGFATIGVIVEIDNNTGAACAVPSSVSPHWDGAGVTTLAPVMPPPPPG